MSDCILEIQNLKKYFRSYWTFRAVPAVECVNLQVYSGESFGFLGHNGAGKTTTIKCIVGLIHLNGGRILLDGEELRRPEQRAKLGYLPEHPYFYDHLTVSETLDFFAGLSGVHYRERKAKVLSTLERVGLAERKHSSVRSLSKGLQQRLGLAQAIIHSPRLLLLDEPFSGLDPIGRVELRELILSLRAAGTTIFISSHILSDVQDICDRVSIMIRGKLQTVFSLAETSELFGERFIVEASGIDAALFSEHVSSHTRMNTQGEVLHFEFDTQEAAERALQMVMQSSGRLLAYRKSAPSLEEVFLRITESETKPRVISDDATVNAPHQSPKELETR